MINFKELGILSGHSYTSNASSYMGVAINPLKLKSLKLKNKHGWYIVKDVHNQPAPKNDFYAGLYIKFERGTPIAAVVAIRGTDVTKMGNDIEDIVSWYSAAMGDGEHVRMPNTYPQAVAFYCHASDYVHDHFPKLYSAGYPMLTGHSLGGALAQLVSLRHAYKPCVVFNSPVCRRLVKASTIAKRHHLIDNINSHYGIINKIGGLPIGKVYVVDVPERATEAKALFTHFDKARFMTGQTLEQQANHEPLQDDVVDKVAGFSEHFAALVDADEGLEPVQDKTTQFIHCRDRTHYLHMVGCMMVVGKQHVNDWLSAANDAIATIKAQHALKNLIPAMGKIGTIWVKPR